MLTKHEEYERIRKEVIDWLPSKIIDSHVHTPLILNTKPVRVFSRGLYNIYFKDKLKVTSENFQDILPGKDLSIIGIPPPYKESVPKIINAMAVKEPNPTLLINDEIKNLQPILKDNVIGIKSHWKIENKKGNFDNLISEEKLEFLEKNKLCLLIEMSDPPNNFDKLKEVDQRYKVKIILPHIGFSHEPMFIPRKDFEDSFNKHRKDYDVFRKLADTKNIFLDISMKTDYDLMATCLKHMGEDRLLFGTDFPFGLTMKIKEDRVAIGRERMFMQLRDILLGREFDERWRYFYNIYLLVWTLKKVCDRLDTEKEKVMYNNAKKIMRKQ